MKDKKVPDFTVGGKPMYWPTGVDWDSKMFERGSYPLRFNFNGPDGPSDRELSLAARKMWS